MSGLRKLAAAGVVLASVQSAEAMTYLKDPADTDTGNDLFVYAKGTIEIGDAQRFRLFLAGLPSWKGDLILTFTSPGGSVKEAMAIAAIIDKRHFVTAAMGECSSACVLPWAAGKQKFVVPKTCIGVHNATVTGVAKKSLAAAEDHWTLSMMTWVAAHGAPHNVLTQMLTTPANAVYCLTAEDLAAWQVTTLP